MMVGARIVHIRLRLRPNSESVFFLVDELFECFSKPGDRLRIEFNSMFGTCQERNLNDIDVLCQDLINVTNKKRVDFIPKLATALAII